VPFVSSNIKYKGTVSTNTYLSGAPQNVTAQAGAFSSLPDFHYVAPITNRLGFGLSVVAPFGLKTNYGRGTAIQYAATMTRLQVVDVSPALGFSITPQISVGAGVDAQRMGGEFDQVGTIGPGTDSDGKSKGWDTAWGYHVGGLYQLRDTTRFGLTYNSQVVHHLRGNSYLVGPVAATANFIAGIPGNAIVSGNTNVHLTLPAFTTLSAYHELNQRWAMMATAIYTQWSVFENLTLKNVAAANLGVVGGTVVPVPSTNTTVNIPTHYRNTWNVSLGTEFHATDKVTLRSGIGYDQSPVTNTYRNLQVPDNDRYALAFGGHFQATKALGFDLGWTHLFVFNRTVVNPPAQAVGAQVTTINGTVNTSADVVGMQVTWNIA